MGWKKTDGRAQNFAIPAGQAIEKGELYRLDGFQFIAMENMNANTVDRLYGSNMAGMVNEDEIWYIKVPAALAAPRGARLWWSAGAGFKRGTLDLVAEGTAGAIGPAVKVEEAKDANNVAAVRLIQSGTSA